MEEQKEEQKPQKSNTLLLVILVILVLVIILGILGVWLGYRYLTSKVKELESQPTTPTTTELETPKKTVPETTESSVKPEATMPTEVSDIISKTFITTTGTKEPQDIGLASFAFDQEPMIAAAELAEVDTSKNIEAKWMYLEASPALNFYTETAMKSPSGKYAVTSVKFNQLSSEMKNYQEMPNTFPMGNYRIDWYVNGQKATGTEFFVSGQ